MHLGARGGLEEEVFLLAVLDLVESEGLEATSGLEETSIVQVWALKVICLVRLI